MCQLLCRVPHPLTHPQVKPQELLKEVGFAEWMELVHKTLDIAEHPELISGSGECVCV